MKKTNIALTALILGMVMQAQAVVFVPTYLQPPSPVPQASTPTVQEVADALGISVDLLGAELYKFTPPSGEEGDVDLFSSVIADTPPPTGEKTVTLTYTGGAPAPLLTYVLLKDGRAGWTIWDASDWNGIDDIQVDNRDLWNPAHTSLSGVSHVTVYGKPGTSVPDGGTTAILLGVALLGIGGVRRFVSRG